MHVRRDLLQRRTADRQARCGGLALLGGATLAINLALTWILTLTLTLRLTLALANPSPNLDPNPNPNPNLDPNLSPNQELDRLTEFSTFYRLPRALATKLRAYNSFRFEVNRGFDIDEITATLPPSLRSEVFLGYG